MMRKPRDIRHLAETALLYPAIFLADHLSPPVAARLATAVGALIYAADSRRRGIACDNIRRSGISTDETRVRQIAKASFCHFAGVIVDSIQSDRLFTNDTWREHTRMEMDPESLALIEKPGQGVILTSGHLGNWEIAAQLISTLKPVTGITRKMNNPYADRLMNKRKPRNRFRLTPKHDADSGRLLAALTAGEVLALLIDQHAPRNRGMMIDVFGKAASTHTSPALLHLVTGIPICFGYCVKTGPASFTFHTHPPLKITPTGNRKQDIRLILEMLTHKLENAIRLYPEQYLWAHRRWR